MRPWINDDDKRVVAEVLDAGDLMSGKRVAEFEEALRQCLGARHVVCVSSGTAALESAFVATGEGGKIHPDGHIAILSAARAAHCTPECSAGFGVTSSVLGIRPRNETPARVYDASHAFGTKDVRGEVRCYSFNANKFIACVGGCIATNDSVVAANCRQYRNHGRDGGPEVFGSGRNHRMGEINAALGLSQLARIDEILARRKQVARWYDELMGQSLAEDRESWFLYPAYGRRALAKKHRSMADFKLFDTAGEYDRDMALLPIWPLMTREDCEAVCTL